MAVLFQGFACHLLVRCLSGVRNYIVFLIGFQVLLNYIDYKFEEKCG